MPASDSREDWFRGRERGFSMVLGTPGFQDLILPSPPIDEFKNPGAGQLTE